HAALPIVTAGRVNSASCGVRSKNSAGRRCSKQASNSHGREAGTGWYSAKRTSCLSKPSGKRWTGSGSKRASHTRAGSLATPAAWKFLSQRRERLRDYRDALRNQLPANKALNGLGAMEACVNRVLAARMKKRTMCWTIAGADAMARLRDRKSKRLNSSHVKSSYAVFGWKKKILMPSSEKKDASETLKLRECRQT